MSIIEQIQEALRSSPSFAFVATCEVARENVLADAADSLMSVSVEVEDAHTYGCIWEYWYGLAAYQLNLMDLS